jgi:hypothetical protein
MVVTWPFRNQTLGVVFVTETQTMTRVIAYASVCNKWQSTLDAAPKVFKGDRGQVEKQTETRGKAHASIRHSLCATMNAESARNCRTQNAASSFCGKGAFSMFIFRREPSERRFSLGLRG